MEIDEDCQVSIKKEIQLQPIGTKLELERKKINLENLHLEIPLDLKNMNNLITNNVTPNSNSPIELEINVNSKRGTRKKSNLEKLDLNDKVLFVFVNPLSGSEEGKFFFNIAEKYNGFLKTTATEEDTIRIGQLLGYKEKFIQDFINRKK